MALKDNPKNIQLIKKLGTALMKMHEFDKAMQHYEKAIDTLNEEELKFSYIELLIKVYIFLSSFVYFVTKIFEVGNRAFCDFIPAETI